MNCYWFRMRRLRRGAPIPGERWIYCQEPAETSRAARRLATVKLRTALGLPETGLPWGGSAQLESVHQYHLEQLLGELRIVRHPGAGTVFMVEGNR